MTYIFKGRLCGLLCVRCPESLSNVTIKLYRHRKDQNVPALAIANAKDTISFVSDDVVQEKASALIAETKTDENGNFQFELGQQLKYNGDAFEVDIYVDAVPGRKKEIASTPLQFTVTTIQPQWKKTENGLLAIWDYCLPYRFWCVVRARFNAWVVCGQVVTCEKGVPLAGLKVSAFDTDWIQDDELGFAFTDSAGKFRIDYTTATFQKTPFSPFINIELTGGPDLFFKIETTAGVVLLQESRSRGREGDRENVGHCFCVELCVDVEAEPPFENPWFTHVGDFHILSHINAVTGLTTQATLGHGGPNYGFFGNQKLKGFCPKNAPGVSGVPMRYRFLYEHPATPGVEVPISGVSLVAPVIVGSRLIQWDLDGSGPDWTFQSIVVDALGATPNPTPIPVVPPGSSWGPVPDHVIVPDADGWVHVDQNALDSGFYGPLIRFKSAGAVPGSAAPGNGAGNPVIDPKNAVAIKLIFEAQPVGGSPPSFRNELQKILINNWPEVRLLDIQQFQGPGASSCTPLTNDLNILYTADHELMLNWRISVISAANVPGGIPILPSGIAPRGGVGNEHLNISSWPNCSYQVWLTTRRALTNGESDDDENSNLVTFCK